MCKRAVTCYQSKKSGYKLRSFTYFSDVWVWPQWFPGEEGRIDGVGHCVKTHWRGWTLFKMCVCVSRVFVIFMSSLLSYLFWSMCSMFVCAWGWFGLPMDLFTPQFSVVCLRVSLGGPAPGMNRLREFCPGPSIFVDVLRIMPMSYLLWRTWLSLSRVCACALSQSLSFSLWLSLSLSHFLTLQGFQVLFVFFLSLSLSFPLSCSLSLSLSFSRFLAPLLSPFLSFFGSLSLSLSLSFFLSLSLLHTTHVRFAPFLLPFAIKEESIRGFVNRRLYQVQVGFQVASYVCTWRR